jgi:hypothetical protein
MKRALTLAMVVSLAGCGGKSLDLGGPAGGSDNGNGGSDPGPIHSTVLVPHQRNTYGLTSEGAYLYWVTCDGLAFSSECDIQRCDKQDCAGTQRSALHSTTPTRFVVRNGTLYLAWGGAIVSCPNADCTAPTTVVAQGATPAVVDDANIYWVNTADNAFLCCPLRGCERATSAPATQIGRVIATIPADDANLYWLAWDDKVASYSIRSAPKSGAAIPKTLVGGLEKAGSIVIVDGYVYWTTLLPNGTIARCPTGGCPDDGPEILLEQQYYPHDLVFEGGVLFWINEVLPVEQLTKRFDRPSKVLGCVAARCADSVEELDEGTAGNYLDPVHAEWLAATMVADTEAIYRFGDLKNVATAGMDVNFDFSVRRLLRKPGK